MCSSIAKQRINPDSPLIPLGSAVEYHPSNENDLPRCHNYRAKLLQGVIVGYDQHPGGHWIGNMKMTDRGELKSAETARQVVVN